MEDPLGTDPNTVGQSNQLDHKEEEAMADLLGSNPNTRGQSDQLDHEEEATTRTPPEPTADPSTRELLEIKKKKAIANKKAQIADALENRKKQKEVQRLLRNYNHLEQEYFIAAVLAYAERIDEFGNRPSQVIVTSPRYLLHFDWNSVTLANDIALIRLPSPVILSCKQDYLV